MSYRYRASCLWALVFLTSCSTEILHDISENEANEVLATLQQQGVAGDKIRTSEGSKVNYTVRVARRDAIKAWRLLQQENLPRPKTKGIAEVFGQPGLIPTATQERALLHHALAGEISRTLQGVEGVLEARVHVVLPARDALAPADAPQPAPRASVLLRTGAAPPLSKEDVQRLVAGSVDGLKPDAVNVIIVANQRRAQDAPVTATAPLVRVGPFLVAESARTLIRASFLGGFILVLFLSVTILLLVRKQRALARSAGMIAEAPEHTRSRALESSLGLISRSLARGGNSLEGKKGS